MADLSSLDLNEACRYLSACDKGLAKIIADVGPCGLQVRSNRSVFEYLCRSIVYQQLSGKAAGTIHGRLLDLFERRRVNAETLLCLPQTQLRSAGLSHPKSLALYDLAQRQQEGLVPARRQLNRMPDEEIVRILSQVRGIGRWSAEMMLIFQLGRPDVLPATDLGIRKGFQISHGGRELPEVKKLLRHGERWRPYRSVASWYLWRANYLP